MYKQTLEFISAHTQNGQLVDREEISAEFDKVYLDGIADYTFDLALKSNIPTFDVILV